MSSGRDIVWKYVTKPDEKVRDKLQCLFCNKLMNEGIYRAKLHIVGGDRNVMSCTKCSLHVKEEVREFIAKKKELKDQMKIVSNFDDLDNDWEDDEDDIAFVEVNKRRKGDSPRSSQGSVSSKKPKRKGPIDVFLHLMLRLL